MCVLRTDYLLDQRTKSLKLVEYNTIACSFGCLSQKVKEIQDYLIDKYGRELAELNYQGCCCKPNSMIQDLQAEPYIVRLVDQFKLAIDFYMESTAKKASPKKRCGC